MPAFSHAGRGSAMPKSGLWRRFHPPLGPGWLNAIAAPRAIALLAMVMIAVPITTPASQDPPGTGFRPPFVFFDRRIRNSIRTVFGA
jgi:hypothetical protein